MRMMGSCRNVVGGRTTMTLSEVFFLALRTSREKGEANAKGKSSNNNNNSNTHSSYC